MPSSRENYNPDRDSWNEYRRQVMDTLTRLSGEIDEARNEAKNENREVEKALQKFKEVTVADLAALKTKATLLGSLGGGIVGAVASWVVQELTRR